MVEVRDSNYVVRTDGALAWAEYDQRLTTPADTMPYVSREQRTLVRRNGDWKILSAGTYDWWSYGTFPRAVEFRLNSLGAALTDAKNYRDAIEVLKLSAQLTPSSPRVYHRLGVVYAAAGETKLAIENYEKSLAIDPKNELGRVALAKLREGKAP